MGTAWAIVFGLGVAAPALLLVGSAVLVHRLAGRLVRARSDARSPWQWVAGHVALVVVVEGVSSLLTALPGGPFPYPVVLATLSMLVVPLYLLRATDRAAIPGVGPGGEAAPGDLERHRLATAVGRRDWAVASLFALTGVALPWLVGLGVKIYLDARGRPTLPVSSFLSPEVLPVLVIQTVTLWAFPFVILASALVVPWRIGSGGNRQEHDSTLPLWLAYAGGVLATIPVFVAIFWEFDAIMLLVPLGLPLLPPMAIGYAIGWWVLRRRHGRGGRTTHGAPPGARPMTSSRQ